MRKSYDLRYSINKAELKKLRRTFVALSLIEAVGIYKTNTDLPPGGSIYIRQKDSLEVHRYKDGKLELVRADLSRWNEQFNIPW